MIFLQDFQLPSQDMESSISCIESRNIFNSYYPAQIFPPKQLEYLSFSPITIFYGGNGSGKSTLLNIIAQKLSASRKQSIDKGPYFDVYCDLCKHNLSMDELQEIKLLSSDDIFEYLLDLRAINTGINRKKEALKEEFLQAKYSKPMDYSGYEELKNITDSRRMTMSKYTRSRLQNNLIKEQSNGESALDIWQREITEYGIYILDEPENSLSPSNQLRLKQFIEDSSRFYHCQFIIATHSVFLLGLNQAKVYDLDASPACVKHWTQLEHIRLTYDFLESHKAKIMKTPSSTDD